MNDVEVLKLEAAKAGAACAKIYYYSDCEVHAENPFDKVSKELAMAFTYSFNHAYYELVDSESWGG